jgi:hypothetical protein
MIMKTGWSLEGGRRQSCDHRCMPTPMTRREMERLMNVVARSERQRARLDPNVSKSDMRALRERQDARRDMVVNAIFSEPEEGQRRGS